MSTQTSHLVSNPALPIVISLAALLVSIVGTFLGDIGLIGYHSKPEINYAVLPPYEVCVERDDDTVTASVGGIVLSNIGNLAEEDVTLKVTCEDVAILGLAYDGFHVQPNLQGGGVGDSWAVYSFEQLYPGASGTIYVTTDQPATMEAEAQYSRGKGKETDCCPPPPATPVLARPLGYLGVAWIVNLILNVLLWVAGRKLLVSSSV